MKNELHFFGIDFNLLFYRFFIYFIHGLAILSIIIQISFELNVIQIRYLYVHSRRRLSVFQYFDLV